MKETFSSLPEALRRSHHTPKMSWGFLHSICQSVSLKPVPGAHWRKIKSVSEVADWMQYTLNILYIYQCLIFQKLGFGAAVTCKSEVLIRDCLIQYVWKMAMHICILPNFWNLLRRMKQQQYLTVASTLCIALHSCQYLFKHNIFLAHLFRKINRPTNHSVCQSFLLEKNYLVDYFPLT